MIEADTSENGWALFLDSWKRYKSMSQLTDSTVIRNELRASCSREVNQLLFSFVGSEELDATDEDTLLGYIKSISVRGVHKGVHRQHFFKMLQADGESITHFVSRLRSQASLCEFKVTCQSSTCQCLVSYADEMVSNQMISGLHNPEHQTRLLAEASSLKSFQDKFDKLISLETTDKSTPHLSHHQSTLTIPSTSAGSRSEYQRQKQTKLVDSKEKDDVTNRSKCRGCGKKFHPQGRSSCPAYKQTCLNCGRMGHFKSVCEQAKRDANAQAGNNSVSTPDDSTSNASSSSFVFAAASDDAPEPKF